VNLAEKLPSLYDIEVRSIPETNRISAKHSSMIGENRQLVTDEPVEFEK
jgi:hypothetical protein